MHFLVEVWRYTSCEDILLLRLTSELVDLRKGYANSFVLRTNVVLITHTNKKEKRTARALFSFLVEVWRFELQASSTRSQLKKFFIQFCAHIARSFRKNISFCTMFPLFTCRKIPVVVSYVVKILFF